MFLSYLTPTNKIIQSSRIFRFDDGQFWREILIIFLIQSPVKPVSTVSSKLVKEEPREEA